jgi:hypothetical protein
MGQGAANGPYAEWLMGEVIKHNDLWICQRVCRFTADQEWYVRYKIDGAWQPWRHLVTASDTGHSNLGSFCWAINLSPTTVAPGGLISGSELKPAGITSGSGLRVYSYALIGTWRCLGYALGKTDVNLYATLWQRIA